jgi:hypothetical protein
MIFVRHTYSLDGKIQQGAWILYTGVVSWRSYSFTTPHNHLVPTISNHFQPFPGGENDGGALPRGGKDVRHHDFRSVINQSIKRTNFSERQVYFIQFFYILSMLQYATVCKVSFRFYTKTWQRNFFYLWVSRIGSIYLSKATWFSEALLIWLQYEKIF